MDDLISRNKLQQNRPEWLNENCVGREEHNKGWNVCNEMWLKTIAEQPIVESPTWIPCSERLPEKSGTYIVTGMWKGETREIWMCKLLVLESFGAGWCNDARKPVIDAWMPLPEPYKGE